MSNVRNISFLSIALSEKAAKVKDDALSNKLAQLSDDILKYKSVQELVRSKKFSSLEISMMKFAMENN